MTTTAPTSPLAVVRDWGWEALVFRAATAVLLLHALDDAFFNRQPGVPADRHVVAAMVAVVVGLAGAVAFSRLRPGLRAALALVFGIFGLVNGMQHVIHVGLDGPAHSDLTGVLAAVAAAVLIALGLAIPFLHRGEGAATRRRRWAIRAAVVAAAALVGFVFLLPAGGAIVQVHKFREPIGDPPSAAYEPVTFRASDGLRISGWYVRSRNRAAVILVHGGGGDRTGPVRHAELLRRHGYGVLLYDSRGRGESEGNHNFFGWGWANDVDGALAFLRDRPGVDPERIGGLGLSTGADVLIEVAASRGRELRAVVSDGATAASFEDHWNAFGVDPATPFTWTYIAAARVLSGLSPPEPLEELVAEVSPTPLFLIAAGRGVPDELEFNRVYAEAAREPFEHWELPEVSHTDAIDERPREYERRVVGFFDEALADGGPPRYSSSSNDP
jgi:uncharacterized protein